ncbi:hypothetical protein EPH_0023730 [Eimeria praecox]|uniref:Uncharacterized protein n=1 Tax=Eimeria praecox TaxID=51316 RepID=U6H8X0_9EIME|nr:hypothetical protein EPH_0023730 [Eimeria praecox]
MRRTTPPIAVAAAVAASVLDLALLPAFAVSADIEPLIQGEGSSLHPLYEEQPLPLADASPAEADIIALRPSWRQAPKRRGATTALSAVLTNVALLLSISAVVFLTLNCARVLQSSLHFSPSWGPLHRSLAAGDPSACEPGEEQEFPEASGVAEAPGLPEASGTDEAPGLPEASGTDEAPGLPEASGAAEAPIAVPETAGFPKAPSTVPETAGLPRAPSTVPEAPGVPAAPSAVPEAAGVPAAPSAVPEAPKLPEAPILPEVTRVPEGTGATGAPETAGSSGTSGAPGAQRAPQTRGILRAPGGEGKGSRRAAKGISTGASAAGAAAVARRVSPVLKQQQILKMKEQDKLGLTEDERGLIENAKQRLDSSAAELNDRKQEQEKARRELKEAEVTLAGLIEAMERLSVDQESLDAARAAVHEKQRAFAQTSLSVSRAEASLQAMQWNTEQDRAALNLLGDAYGVRYLSPGGARALAAAMRVSQQRRFKSGPLSSQEMEKVNEMFSWYQQQLSVEELRQEQEGDPRKPVPGLLELLRDSEQVAEMLQAAHLFSHASAIQGAAEAVHDALWSTTYLSSETETSSGKGTKLKKSVSFAEPLPTAHSPWRSSSLRESRYQGHPHQLPWPQLPGQQRPKRFPYVLRPLMKQTIQFSGGDYTGQHGVSSADMRRPVTQPGPAEPTPSAAAAGAAAAATSAKPPTLPRKQSGGKKAGETRAGEGAQRSQESIPDAAWLERAVPQAVGLAPPVLPPKHSMKRRGTVLTGFGVQRGQESVPDAAVAGAAALGAAALGAAALRTTASRAAASGIATPRAAAPGAATPRAAAPGAATPRAAAPGAAIPRAAAPGTATPRAAAPGTATPRAAAPRAAAPGTATPRAAAPGAATPRAAAPGVATPRAVAPGAATPRATAPGAATPRAAESRAAVPQAEAGGAAAAGSTARDSEEAMQQLEAGMEELITRLTDSWQAALEAALPGQRERQSWELASVLWKTAHDVNEAKRVQLHPALKPSTKSAFSDSLAKCADAFQALLEKMEATWILTLKGQSEGLKRKVEEMRRMMTRPPSREAPSPVDLLLFSITEVDMEAKRITGHLEHARDVLSAATSVPEQLAKAIADLTQQTSSTLEEMESAANICAHRWIGWLQSAWQLHTNFSPDRTPQEAQQERRRSALLSVVLRAEDAAHSLHTIFGDFAALQAVSHLARQCKDLANEANKPKEGEEGEKQ